ncbi:AsmA family protein [Desulfolithobacter sp.]
MSVVKWLLTGVVGVVILVVVAIFALPLVMDNEALKHQLSRRIEQKTGHSLQIEGALKWSVFPWIGLEIDRLTVGNAPGFGEEPLATVEELDVKVALAPLLHKRVVADTVTLRGIRLNLIRDSAGRGNWEIPVTGVKEKEQEETEEAEAPKEDDRASSGLSMELDGLSLENVTLRFEDRQEDSIVEIQDLSLDVGSLVADTPAPVQLWFRMTSTEPKLDLKVGMTTRFSCSRNWQRLELQDLGLDLEIQGAGLPAQGLHVELTGDLGLDRQEGVLNVRQVSLTGPGAEVVTSLNVTGLDVRPRVSGKVELRQVNPRELLRQLGMALQTRDPEVLTILSGTVAVILEGDTLTLKPVSLKLDDTAVAGDIEVRSFSGPVVRAGITVDDIDLDRYLPPEAAEKSLSGSSANSEAPAVGQRQGGEGAPSFDGLRRLDLEARLRVGALKVRNLRMRQLAVDMSAKDGVIGLRSVQAELYGGQLTGDFLVDLRQDTLKFQVSERLVGIAVGPLLRDLTGKEQLTGNGNVSVDVTGKGANSDVITKQLNGTMSFVLRDGAYKGFNLALAIRRARSALAGQEVAADQVQQTDFTELRGSAIIRRGVVENRDFYMASPLLRVTGAGKVDLGGKTVDYLVTAKVVGSLTGQNGGKGDQLTGVAIPVRIKGPLDKPRYMVDVEAALRASAEQQLEQKKQEFLDKATRKIQGRTGGQLLKGLLGQ